MVTTDLVETNFTVEIQSESSRGNGHVASKRQLDNEERLRYENQLYYKVDEVPPWPYALLFGFQQVMVCTSGVVAAPLIIADLICAKFSSLAKVKLIGTQMFVTGLSTVLQTTFGLRLPLLQGPSANYLPPIIALMSIDEFRCPRDDQVSGNFTLGHFNSSAQLDADEVWMSRMRMIQGGLIVSSFVQMLLGFTGLIGILAKFIGPLTIAPLMICLEIALVDVILIYASKHWMSIIMMLVVLLFAFYLGAFNVPIPTLQMKEKRLRLGLTKVPIFHLFPYILALGTTWILCLILTKSGAFDSERDRSARTDVHEDLLSGAPWFRFPYPGQWGLPVFHPAAFVGMLTGTLCVVVESVGDYHAAAKVCCQPPPPSHAVNRAIFVEGICCLSAGFIGSGSGITTYSENIGVIGITKVASRRTMQFAGLIFMGFAVFTKVGGVLANIPDPLLGGILASGICVIGGVGIASLQSVDMRQARNMWILGFAILLGVLVPRWVAKCPVKTGVVQFDQVCQILLSTGMVVAGLTGCILDNSVPGATREQRGLQPHSSGDTEEINVDDKVYSFPPICNSWMDKLPFAKFIPIFPHFSAPRYC